MRFLEKFPNAAAAASASLADVTQLAGPLGLQEKRPVAIIRFSREMKSEDSLTGSSMCYPRELYHFISLETCCNAWHGLHSWSLSGALALLRDCQVANKWIAWMHEDVL